MKRVFMQGLIFPFLLLFVVSCQKEDSFPMQGNADGPVALRTDLNGGCRMTSYDLYDGIDDAHRIDRFTYKDGLLENVYPSYEGWRFNMVYDAQKRLIASNVFLDEVLVGLVEFTYEKNRPVLETWLHPETREVEDEVFYTYNRQGYLLRTESFMFDIYTNYTYTRDGNLESNQVFLGGVPWFRADYTYEGNYKNPFRSVPGLELQFWYSNSGFGTGREWYSSEKITLYDENGEPIIHYEQDAAQTTWQTAAQHYPLVAGYVDMHTQAIITNTFEYENCVPGQASRSESFRQHKTRNFEGKRKGKAIIFNYPSREAIERLKQTR